MQGDGGGRDGGSEGPRGLECSQSLGRKYTLGGGGAAVSIFIHNSQVGNTGVSYTIYIPVLLGIPSLFTRPYIQRIAVRACKGMWVLKH